MKRRTVSRYPALAILVFGRSSSRQPDSALASLGFKGSGNLSRSARRVIALFGNVLLPLGGSEWSGD